VFLEFLSRACELVTSQEGYSNAPDKCLAVTNGGTCTVKRTGNRFYCRLAGKLTLLEFVSSVSLA